MLALHSVRQAPQTILSAAESVRTAAISRSMKHHHGLVVWHTATTQKQEPTHPWSSLEVSDGELAQHCHSLLCISGVTMLSQSSRRTPAPGRGMTTTPARKPFHQHKDALSVRLNSLCMMPATHVVGGDMMTLTQLACPLL